MGKIVINLDAQGNIQLASDFGPFETLVLVEKARQAIVNQPLQLPHVRPAPAAVLDRLNGHPPRG